MEASGEAEAVLLFSLPKDCSITSIAGGAATPLGAGGALEILSAPQAAHDLVFLRSGTFVYPLVGQPVLRVSLRRYLFSGVDVGDAKVLVVVGDAVPLASVLELEGHLASFTAFHNRLGHEETLDDQDDLEEVTIPLHPAEAAPPLPAAGAGRAAAAAAGAGVGAGALALAVAAAPPAPSSAVVAAAAAQAAGGDEAPQPPRSGGGSGWADFVAGARGLAGKVANEFTNPESKLRAELIPKAHTATSGAVRTVIHEVGNKDSKLRSELLPNAGATLVAAAAAVHHELAHEDSTFRTAYVAPAVAAASAAAVTVHHELAHEDSTFRTAYVAPAVAAASAAAHTVAHEVLDPTSKLRGEILPNAASALRRGANTVAHELRDADSDLRAVHLPAAAAAAASAAAAVQHEFVDPHSELRANYLTPIATELSHPTVAGIGGGIAVGVERLGQGTHAALVGTADLAGKGIRLVAAGAGSLVGSRAGPPVTVSPATRARLDNARLMTRTVVVVTTGLVQGAATMARSLGASAAVALGETGVGKAIASSGETAGGRAACRVAASTVGAVGAVWEGLELAARTLGGHVGGAASEFVGMRYGAEAQEATDKGLAVVGDMAEVTLLSGMHLTPVTLLAQSAGAATLTTTAAAEQQGVAAAAAAAAGAAGAAGTAGAAGGAGGGAATEAALEDAPSAQAAQAAKQAQLDKEVFSVD